MTDDAGLDAGSQLNQAFVRELLGQGVIASLSFVTTKWSKHEELREQQEDREEEWKDTLKANFPDARFTRLDYDHRRSTEKQLEAMGEGRRKVEQDKYRQNVLNVVKFALENPATEATLLEKEVGGNGKTVGETSVFKAAAISREMKIKAVEPNGDVALAKAMREDVLQIANTKVEDASEVEKRRQAARKLALEAGYLATGNEAVGRIYDMGGELVIDVCSLVSTEKQQKAVREAYDKRMVPRVLEATKMGANVAGKPGAMVAGMAAMAYNCLDAVAVWAALLNT
jgi:hypothetical protein